MNIIIAGGRDFNNYQLLKSSFSSFIENNKINTKDVVIVSGGARGADNLGEKLAEEYNFKCKIYPANWNLFGKSAGYKRNIEMAENSEALLAFWDGVSSGTKHMINFARQKNLIVEVISYKMLKIGITERGDSSLDYSWIEKINNVDGAVIITKNLTDQLILKLIEFKEKIILHSTITGYGGTLFEPNIKPQSYSFDQLYDLINLGFPVQNIVIRIDPFESH